MSMSIETLQTIRTSYALRENRKYAVRAAGIPAAGNFRQWCDSTPGEHLQYAPLNVFWWCLYPWTTGSTRARAH